MSDSVSFSEESRSANKFFAKHKWRGKLFSADSRFGRAADDVESTDDDVASFLHTAGTRPEVEPQSAPLAPRIDNDATGSRRPPAASLGLENTLVDVYRRPKPRQNKGLRVRFVSAPPAIIGEGGDEARLPSRDAFRFADTVKSERSPSRELLHYNMDDQHSRACERPTDRSNEISFRPLPLQRRPTGFVDETLGAESYHAGHDREVFEPAFSVGRKSSPPLRKKVQDVDPNLQNGHKGDSCYRPYSASEDLSPNQSNTWETAENEGPGATRHLVAHLPESLLANTLTLSQSPEPSYISKKASSSSNYSPFDAKVLPKLPNSEHQGTCQESQDSQDFSHSPEQKPLSVTKSLGDESLNDFDLRVRRFNDLFRLNASVHGHIMAVPFEQWAKVSAWWLLRGRGGLESAVRGKSSTIASADAASDGELSSRLKQAYVNLAKAWWVVKHITPNLPEVRRFGNPSLGSVVAMIRSEDPPLAELVNVHLSVLANMRTLTKSMKRNGRLPPEDLQLQRSEAQIFLDTPTFPPNIATLIVNNIPSSPVKGEKYTADPFFPILVGDTDRHFNFASMFVEVFWDSGDGAKSGIATPCVVSLLRERTDWAVKATIASQDGQINLVIQSSEHDGLHWHAVQWKIPLHMMQLRLADGIYLHVKFSEKDFKTIWGICDYTQRTRKEYSARRGEEMLLERKLPVFQCFDFPSFPAEPTKDCRVRLFKRKPVAVEGRGQCGAYYAYRLMVITPPTTKTLSKVNYQLGKDSPVLFGTHRSKGGDTLLVRVPSSLRVALTFKETKDVELFRSALAGTWITEEDHCLGSLHLQNLTISSVSIDQDMACKNASCWISGLRWQKLRIINGGPLIDDHNLQSKIRSEHLRILADCDYGTFTDRIHAESGELRLNLSVENLNEIRLLLPPQQDMTWGLADGVLREADLSSLSHILLSMGTSPSVRTYHFRCLSDLHSFQAMLTGFRVLYDGLATTFSISRQRVVVPTHKHWEASTPRLQIVTEDKTVQLVVFFKDFRLGACMNFVLKATDFFDTFARSGVFFLRIVDAKFALPKKESDPANDFVCLDMPEYPNEHDDIIIGFDNEPGKQLKSLILSGGKSPWTDQAADRDRFIHTLPAPVNKMSHMVSLRR